MSKFTIADLEQRITSAPRRRPRCPTPASCSTGAWRNAPRNSARRRSRPRSPRSARTASALVGEAADLLYHLLVMLHARGVTLAEVEALLETRTKKSGLEEKASRPRE